MKVLKQISSIMGILLCIICIPVVVVNAVLIFHAYTNPDHIPGAFGTKPMICLSGSMSPVFEPGDMVFIKETDVSLLKEGDVICYLMDGTAVTHRIIRIVDENGTISYVTKGDANNTEDAILVPQTAVEGIYSNFKVDGLGNFAIFVQSTTGMILFVVCPLLLFVVYNVIRQSINAKIERERALQLERELQELKKKKKKKTQEKEKASV